MSKEKSQYLWKNLPRFIPSEQQHKVKHLWWHFLPERGITTIYGPRGSWKSPFIFALCDAISKDKPFLDHQTRGRRVLYLDKENPESVLYQRDKGV